MSSVIVGPRKRKPSLKKREGEQQKKKKTTKKTTIIQKETPHSTSHSTTPSLAPSGSRSHSVEVEEIEDEDSNVGTKGPGPRNESNVLELEDESGNDSVEEVPEAAEEDAEKQLSMFSFIH